MLTPILLNYYGPHIAFGLPGLLMLLATIVFWMGRNVFIHIPPGGMKFLRETFSREGVFAILKLTPIYIFVAIFWALFDQTGSTWVIQAEHLNRHWMGIEWLPSQIQAINPIMILIFAPLFAYFLYPKLVLLFYGPEYEIITHYFPFILSTGSVYLIIYPIAHYFSANGAPQYNGFILFSSVIMQIVSALYFIYIEDFSLYTAVFSQAIGFIGFSIALLLTYKYKKFNL